jgi:hypothetical protein
LPAKALYDRVELQESAKASGRLKASCNAQDKPLRSSSGAAAFTCIQDSQQALSASCQVGAGA